VSYFEATSFTRPVHCEPQDRAAVLEAAQAVENERRARLKLGQEISDQLRELGLA